VFEKSGEVMIDVTVDNNRKPDAGGMMQGDHAGHGMKHGG
jgi:hypothetical protein